MTERGASSTAVLVCQGRATADGRYAVGRFSDPVARELLDAADRELVDQVRAGDVPTRAADRMAYEMVRRTGLTMVPRTIAIDDAIRDHVAGQLVLLGAGLDSRAYRMPELAATTVFEVDHPASQRDKLRRVRALAPVAERLVPVAVDLTSERLAGPLDAAGFDTAAVSTWVWEGVVPYLSAADVRATVAQLAELTAPGSRLVINYQARSLPTSVMRKVMRLVLRLSGQPDPLAHEPWRSLWRPEVLRKLLADNGFSVVSDVDLLTGAEGLALPAENIGSRRNGRVAVAVRN
ncbi:class I SAM-dependent methyltransferase [Pedococcus bigeumensis]|uniref:S-adenosyl-L-methionine-dependent methyltransferase n=1 Tax=Pedococcus bigeumensis TaxID=433644 RepID=A0A502D2A9_9MICO|nr:class I SAM-dependent methyltransferase [Pedococcus bigeumensis]TPG18141.1 SAM-dependent methyltransferase [Pedococcus bigeumensis]